MDGPEAVYTQKQAWSIAKKVGVVFTTLCKGLVSGTPLYQILDLTLSIVIHIPNNYIYAQLMLEDTCTSTANGWKLHNISLAIYNVETTQKQQYLGKLQLRCTK